MGKLNIAHHKSYHPYRRDNIERVRRDEEEARLKEVVQEGKIALADAEARIDVLRQRAGLPQAGSSGQTAVEEPPEAGPSSLTSGGHINLFEDLERSLPISIRTTSKSNAPAPSTEQGIPLAPSEKDRNPWYSDREKGPPKELDGNKHTRELARKSAHDPLTSINQQLARRSGDHAMSSVRSRTAGRLQSIQQNAPSQQPEVAERLSRESSERQRALELIRRKKREMDGSATPSTVRSGMGGGYGDVFNRREVEDAHRHRAFESRNIRDNESRNSRRR
ncbi:hypothetical protein BDW22DRAFT_1194657 [Trametopsis cervina]|nr:hypothetical protein BDW22DRAFT_1194657 [Trametopsis cervina]